MKYLFAITLYLLFSTSYANDALVDPDSISSSMPVVEYIVPADNLKITEYRLGSPSHLQVKLCKRCKEKAYELEISADLRLLDRHLDKTKLAEVLLSKQHPLLRLVINRKKGMITHLHVGVDKNIEFVPTSAFKKTVTQE
tara:strand:- start:3754 stop:4173 length:420 start_codon:yes stop_codon:yes gene_type:complete